MSTIAIAARYDCLTCKSRNCSILNTCDADTLKDISNSKHTGSLQKGEKLFSEGDSIKGIYFIKTGFLKVELNGGHDRPLILRIAGGGTMFGHRVSATHNYHCNAATAVTDVRFCFIPYNRFNEITGRNPLLRQQLTNQLLSELEFIEMKALHLAHKSVREKVAEALLRIAEAYQYDDKKHSFRISFCRQDIADMAGTTKEQVSKVLKDFEKDDIVKCAAKKFSYLNTNILQTIAYNTPVAQNGEMKQALPH